MARDFGPFPTKLMYEVVNRRMQKALAEATSSTGFAKAGQGAVAAGTGAQLVIAAYPDGALIDGLYVENPASETVTLTTNTASTNPRIDRLVMRLDMSAQTIAPFQIVGTPAASPQIPPLVQTAAVYDMPLVRYTMPGSASAQNPGSIVNERVSCTADSLILGPDIGVGTGATAPGPATAHPPRTIDPGALFGYGYGARVEIDAYILGDCPSGRWDLELVSPALSTTSLRRDSRTFAGRNTLNLSYSVTIPPGTTRSFSTRLANGTGTLTTYADIVANAAVYTVHPYLP